MRVLRIYHAGRDRAHRARDRALADLGVDVTLVVPSAWPGSGDEVALSEEPFPVVEVPVNRPGDVNRWSLTDPTSVARLAPDVDLVDLHAEPFSTVVAQARSWLPPARPVVGYTAQNLDKRLPPPFAQRELAGFGRLAGLYPCSRQAASVANGKGFRGLLEVLPLGWPPQLRPGRQSSTDPNVQLALVGRLQPEKGVLDAVRILAHLQSVRPARLLLVGDGPEHGPARELAHALGVGDRLEVRPWLDASALAEVYAASHVVLVPSRRTARWVEQYGRVVVEAQATGAVVAAYATGSLPEVVGEAGLLAPEGEHEALTRQLVDVLNDRSRYALLQQRGFARAEQATWTAIARAQLAFYEAAIDAGPPLPPRPDRAAAVARWGPPAEVAGGGRPYALPVLREHAPWARALGRTQDALSLRR